MLLNRLWSYRDHNIDTILDGIGLQLIRTWWLLSKYIYTHMYDSDGDNNNFIKKFGDKKEMQ